jgi:hypothetical protein
MNRWMSAVILASTVGCSDTRDLELLVDQSGEQTTISWDVGDATLVTVTRCDGDCECLYMKPLVGASRMLEGGTDVVWRVGYDFDVQAEGQDREAALELLEEIKHDPDLIQSPVTYGDPDVPGDLLHMEAVPLEPGQKYGVEATIIGPCDPDSPECSHTDASGCTIFDAK